MAKSKGREKRLSASALRIFNCPKCSMALVMPHPGQGMPVMARKGQIEKCGR
ncbi:MAG: hypothetical protein NG737_00945 [Omnitrophica bacterium]|nr:hypothetical protein [Candidatus Omnitrophota bacterium]